jgi:hypothetical protein
MKRSTWYSSSVATVDLIASRHTSVNTPIADFWALARERIGLPFAGKQLLHHDIFVGVIPSC